MIAVEAYQQVGQSPEEAFNAKLLEQLPQVKYIAHRIHERLPQHVPFEDLLHAGIVGLIDALHKFDPCKNVRFESYAKFRIRGAILDSLREMDWSPRELRRKARRLQDTTQALQTQLGRSATEPELAQAMGMSLRAFQQLLDEIRGLSIGSFQSESLEDGSEMDLCESIPGPPDQDPLLLYLKAERKEELARAISRLPERDQQVLALYYQEELTMKEVGAVLGIGESRVSQLHSLAVVRLRAALEAGRKPRSQPLHLSSPAETMPGNLWKRS
jgi:RNA polymerase sigma factor for flagellar operon FliA